MSGAAVTAEPALRELVAQSIYNRGIALREQGNLEEAIACFDLVDARYRDAPEPALRELVAGSIYIK